MTLRQLIERVRTYFPVRADREVSPARLDVPVKAIAYDSRHAAPGSVFVALRGQRTDGTAFAAQAVARGAIAVVAEVAPPAPSETPWYIVANAREALSALSAEFYNHPSHDLALVGITGTNGKTTTAYLVSSIFEQAGIRCGRLGTVSYQIAGQEQTASRTTPEAPDVHRMLRGMVDARCGACAMEVSSHALALRRVEHLRFAAGIFTNVTRDHLDFHGDMESYFLAKQRLFELLPASAIAAVNLDDPRAERLMKAGGRPVSYAIDHKADVRPGPLTFSFGGLAFDVTTPRGPLRVRSKLVGRPNVYNILGAVAACAGLDLSFGAIERGIAALESVPGRFQVVSTPQDDVTVVVDYAHTDDALKNLLETARPLAPGRLITVFGCGGDRDRTKRPLMGAVAARLSDLVVITSDNPRSEDPRQIIEEIKRGIVQPKDRVGPAAGKETPWMAIPERRDAIERAVRESRPGDVVLIAGKGHEQYQEIGERILPFDDVSVAREALARRRTSSHVR
jgi:UDP-N-acetylmuramoyl-L-alanyl-D-glutamate--2,6-diaminopimelate ligase